MKRNHLVGFLALALLIGSLSISCHQEKKEKAQEEAAETQIKEDAVKAELDSLILAQVKEAKSVIGATFNAVRFYKNDNNKFPTSFEELEAKEYLYVDSISKFLWDFSLIVEEQKLIKIKAVSTDQMKGGVGNVILFDVENGDFSGYVSPVKTE